MNIFETWTAAKSLVLIENGTKQAEQHENTVYFFIYNSAKNLR